MSAVDVLKIDFEEALSHIDFSKEYDPLSKSFMKALFLGELWTATKNLEDDVDEELSDAENYWILFCETGDSVYKEMANDELKHAGILIKKHLLKTTDEKRKHSLNEQEKKRQEMLKIVSVSKSDD